MRRQPARPAWKALPLGASAKGGQPPKATTAGRAHSRHQRDGGAAWQARLQRCCSRTQRPSPAGAPPFGCPGLGQGPCLPPPRRPPVAAPQRLEPLRPVQALSALCRLRSASVRRRWRSSPLPASAPVCCSPGDGRPSRRAPPAGRGPSGCPCACRAHPRSARTPGPAWLRPLPAQPCAGRTRSAWRAVAPRRPGRQATPPTGRTR
mmetsp:Transcript_24465/g.92410  ORF Transcript_24465/g.92410 Transcript_24465/m.92410 type:complete len:206 (-) Transcript_24465:789-1406(-)